MPDTPAQQSTRAPGARVRITRDDDDGGFYRQGEIGTVLPLEDWDDSPVDEIVRVGFDAPAQHHSTGGTSWVSLRDVEALP